MKMVKSGVAVLLVLVMAGCSNKSEPGGGKAADNKTFRLSGPSGSTTIQQGDTQTVAVSVNRDKEFTDDISLMAEAPTGSGLTARLADEVVKNDTTTVNLKVTAAPDATVGTHKVRVVSKPTRGNAVDVLISFEVKLSPSAKEKGK